KEGRLPLSDCMSIPNRTNCVHGVTVVQTVGAAKGASADRSPGVGSGGDSLVPSGTANPPKTEPTQPPGAMQMQMQMHMLLRPTADGGLILAGQPVITTTSVLVDGTPAARAELRLEPPAPVSSPAVPIVTMG